MFSSAQQTAPCAATRSHGAETGSDVSRASESDLDQAIAIFLAERTRLFRIAYPIVGNVAAAEDVVQEAWLRWQRTNRREIDNPAAFLTTATARLAINMIQSAGHRHETQAAASLANLVDRSEDPSTQAEHAVAVEHGLSLLMARLTSSEMAVFLLRTSFDYPYRDIARILRTSAPNARQLALRARRNLVAGHPRRVDPDLHRQLVRAFLRAARTGDLAELEHLLAEGDRFTVAESTGPVHRAVQPAIDPSAHGHPGSRPPAQCDGSPQVRAISRIPSIAVHHGPGR